MELSQTEKAKLVRYLLGQLSEPEQQVLEESVFADQAKFYQLCEVEDQLIDGYARNQLRDAERSDFELHYLTQPARRARVEFARTLTAEFDQPETTGTPAWWQSFFESLRQPALAWGLAAATLFFLAVTVWWLFSHSPRSSELARQGVAGTPTPARAISPTPVASPTPAPLLRDTPLPKPITVPATVTLSTLTLRGEPRTASETLRIAPGQTSAQIQVKLPDQDYPVYEVRLQTIAGQPVRSWQAKPANTKAGQAFALSLPTRLLASGDYLLVLEARTTAGTHEPIAKLPFKVVKP